MNDCRRKFNDYLYQNSLILKGKSILLASSGGPDSIFMSHLLFQLKEFFHIKELAIAYFNHKTRVSCAEEADFVKNFADRRSVPFFYGEMLHTTEKEAMLRQARYTFLREVAEKNKFDYIATAHTSSDNAETVFMKILRGTYFGLQGICPLTNNILRPILCFSREEVLRYNRENNLCYVVDPSNFDNKKMRNNIRNRIFPMLKQINGHIAENLNHIAALFSIDDLFISNFTKNLPNAITVINAEKFFALPPPVRIRYLLRILKPLFNGNNPLRFNHFRQLQNNNRRFKFKIRHGWIIERSYGNIYIYNPAQLREKTDSVQYNGEDRIEFNGFPIEFSINNKKAVNYDDNLFFAFDYAEIAKPIFITTRRSGDLVETFPKRNKKKLKEIFINNGVPALFREFMPVVRDKKGNILCVPSVIRGYFAPVTDATKKTLYIKNLINFDKNLRIDKISVDF